MGTRSSTKTQAAIELVILTTPVCPMMTREEKRSPQRTPHTSWFPLRLALSQMLYVGKLI